MKQRFGFVSNSSSTAFVVTNKTKEPKTMKDFAEETAFLVEQFRNEYGIRAAVTKGKFLRAAGNYKYGWGPKEKIVCSFGDEDYNAMGMVLDYMLRDGGESKSFKWRFHHWER
jgi:hypothetical protein